MSSHVRRIICLPFVVLITFVAVCRGTPVQKSAPGIEILPAAFSDGNGPKYVVVGDNENQLAAAPAPVGLQSRLEVPIETTTQQPPVAPIVYQTTAQPAPVQYQQPQQVQYQQPQQIQYRQPQQVQQPAPQQVLYQQPASQQYQYQQSQPIQYQQSAYQPQAPVYYQQQPPAQYAQPSAAYSPYNEQYIRRPNTRPEASSSSPGFLNTIARAFGLNTGSSNRNPQPSMTSSPSALGLLGTALL
uniref:DUF4794 domain-containing protein n=1 Tax=Anopheles christyi TaxID=43041 RepID=A0A182JV74_9DIPT